MGKLIEKIVCRRPRRLSKRVVSVGPVGSLGRGTAEKSIPVFDVGCAGMSCFLLALPPQRIDTCGPVPNIPLFHCSTAKCDSLLAFKFLCSNERKKSVFGLITGPRKQIQIVACKGILPADGIGRCRVGRRVDRRSSEAA